MIIRIVAVAVLPPFGHSLFEAGRGVNPVPFDVDFGKS